MVTKMIENTSQTVRKVSAKIPETEIALAKAYIQGAVHAHCSSDPASELSVRILFGGDNRDWGNTPLQAIYEYHKDIKKAKDPAGDAAKDVGWLLKAVLTEDARTFEYVGKDTGGIYRIRQSN